MKKLTAMVERHYTILYWMILAGSVGMYISLAFGRDIWFDEAYTLSMIRRGFKDMCLISAADVHPPLYYILLKLFTLPFQNKILGARLFAIACNGLMIGIGGNELSKLLDKTNGIIFMLMFSLFPRMTYYSIEIRMYSLAALFVFLTGIFAYKFWLTKKMSVLCGLTIFGVCSAYTHYFAFVSICVIYAILLIALYKKDKTGIGYWALAIIVSIIMYLPWIGFFVKQLAIKVTDAYWIEPIAAKTFVGYLTELFMAKGMGSYPLYIAVVYLILFVSLLKNKNKSHKMLGLCALLVPVATVVLGVLVSVTIRPVFIIRYLIPAVPLMLIFASISLRDITHDTWIASLATVILIGATTNYMYMFQLEYKVSDNIIDKAFVEKYADCDCWYITTTSGHYMGIISYYAEEKTVYYQEGNREDYPFINCRSIDDFICESNDTVIAVTNYQEGLSDEMQGNYDIKTKEEIVIGESKADVYYLVRK